VFGGIGEVWLVGGQVIFAGELRTRWFLGSVFGDVVCDTIDWILILVFTLIFSFCFCIIIKLRVTLWVCGVRFRVVMWYVAIRCCRIST